MSMIGEHKFLDLGCSKLLFPAMIQKKVPLLSLIIICVACSSCRGWSGNEVGVTATRRQWVKQGLSVVGWSSIAWLQQPAFSSNLPVPTGADTSKVGTVDTLIPLVVLRDSMVTMQRELSNQSPGKFQIDGSIPKVENEFKKLFDSYSEPISYKQRFLDQNAFLVYYTKGFDGPGRGNIEDDINERQTQQFGLRNEAWIAWENFLTELKYIDDKDNDCAKYLASAVRSLDAYLDLAPKADLEAAYKAQARSH